MNCVQLLYKRQLLTFTFARAQILIDENLQLSICFNQTSLQRDNNLINLKINTQDILIVKARECDFLEKGSLSPRLSNTDALGRQLRSDTNVSVFDNPGKRPSNQLAFPGRLLFVALNKNTTKRDMMLF